MNLILEPVINKDNVYMVKDEKRNYYKIFFNSFKNRYTCQYQLTRKERMDKKYKHKNSSQKLFTFFVDEFKSNEILEIIKQKIIESKRPKNPYTKIRNYEIDEILPLIVDEDEVLFTDKKVQDNKKYVELEGYGIKINSTRLRTFKRQLECQHCKMKAKYFSLEIDNGKQIHLNLYGLNEFGHEILFTSDHIIPLAKKGKKLKMENRQTLCQICNSKKGDKI